LAINLADYEEGRPFDGDYRAALDEVQKRLSRILVAHVVCRQRSMILFEGWDAAGKGGAIQRLTTGWDPRHFHVWPIGAPTEEELQRHFLWRFWRKIPGKGHVAIFDRSWYGRVLVERVEAYATERCWRRAYDEINEFEAQQQADGVNIVKLFFHVTREEQDKRLAARLDHPWKRWKVTPDDFRNRARRDDYLEATHDMFEETDTRWAPWKVIDGNDKKSARIAALTHVADRLERCVPADPPEPDPDFDRYARAQLDLPEKAKNGDR
jgi:polyphosphate kinase 2 (PPK2 family)